MSGTGASPTDLRTSTPFVQPQSDMTRQSPYDQTQQAPRQAYSAPSLPDLRTSTPYSAGAPPTSDPFPSAPVQSAPAYQPQVVSDPFPRQASSGPQIPTTDPFPPPSAPVSSDPFPSAPPQFPVSSDPFQPPAAPPPAAPPPMTWGGAFGGPAYNAGRPSWNLGERSPNSYPVGGYPQSQPYGQPVTPYSGSTPGILGYRPTGPRLT